MPALLQPERETPVAFTYDASSTTEANKLRRIIGNTVASGLVDLADADVTRLITQYTTAAVAAIPALDERIASAYGMVTTSSGSESEQLSLLATQLEKLRSRLVALGYAEPAGSTESISRVRQFDRHTVNTDQAVNDTGWDTAHTWPGD